MSITAHHKQIRTVIGRAVERRIRDIERSDVAGRFGADVLPLQELFVRRHDQHGATGLQERKFGSTSRTSCDRAPPASTAEMKSSLMLSAR